MNLKATVVAGACFIILTYAHGIYQYRSGWVEGRANLVSQQQQKAQAELAKKTQRQQQNDTKAAAAESEGKENAEAITREVIKYVTRPGRTVCEFPPERVSIKRRAAENANSIPGYDVDAAAVQNGTAK
ncbi:putative spanin [Salmonella phage dunkel]|uniref:Putative spanin n=1 Tax=Salmonella phage dunkel TaxID=2713293 RepID=A0A6G8R9L8_9CAUD|nr:putative spanin [Salmonella phage dunkel]QIN98101.1 putative spanin [Salmonella phage dunkel]